MQNYTFDEVKMSHVAMLGAKNSLVSKARRAASGQGLANKAGFAVFVAALFLYEIWFSLVVYIDLLFKNLFGKRKKAILAVVIALLLFIGAIAGVNIFKKNTSKRPVLSSTQGEGEVTENAGQATDGAEQIVVADEDLDSEDVNSNEEIANEANSEAEKVLRPVLRADGTLDYGDLGDPTVAESSDDAEESKATESDQTEESEAVDPDHTKELDDYVEKIAATGFSISDADESNTGETTEGEDKLPEGKLPVISTKDSGEGATASGSENTSSSSNGSASDSESSSSSSRGSSAGNSSLSDIIKNSAGTSSTSDTERTSSSSSNATSRRIPDSLIPELPESGSSSRSGVSTGSGSGTSTGSRSSSGIGTGSSSSSASKDTGKVYYEVDAPLAKDEDASGSGSSQKGDKNVKGTVTSRKEDVGLDSSNTVEVDVTNTGVGISGKADSTVDGGSSTVGHGSLVTKVEVPTNKADNKPDYTQMSFDELREENPDFYGLVSSDDANIDSMVMFCKERMDEYLYRDFNGNDDKNGLPSIVDEVSGDLSTIIIYARNTDGNGEFAGILKYSDKASIKDESIIKLDKDGESQEFKVITSFTEKGGSEEGMLKIGDKAKLGDCFLVLVTDMPDGDRFYIIAQSM